MGFLEPRTPWYAEDGADPKLLQPGEQVVSDFDRHL
jgi:hypothetical protein